MANAVNVIQVFSAEAVVKAGTATSKTIDLSSLNVNGYFSLQVEETGDGIAKYEFLLSNNGTDFLTPTGSSDIVTAFIKTTGPGSDGKNIYSFEPKLSKFIQIKVTETKNSGTDALVASAWLAVQ